MNLSLWLFLSAVLATFGMPLMAVAFILRGYEISWDYPPGSKGSTRTLLCAGLLCLPLILYSLWSGILTAFS
jgi:hypothetical protein